MEPTNQDLYQIIHREEEIVDPNLSAVEKVGKMARLCYRSEPKEGEDDNAVNQRIIRQCIKNGHESVLEHVAMSVYLPIRESTDSWKIIEKLTGTKGQHAIFRQVWEHHATETQRKYLTIFNDPELEEKFFTRKLLAQPQGGWSVRPSVVGDVRAWRSVLREKLFVSVNMDHDPLQTVITLLVLRALYEAEPLFFEDIVEQSKLFILREAAADSKDPIDKFIINRLAELRKEKNIDVKQYENDAGKLLNDSMALLFDNPDDVIAAEAAKCCTFSVILTTDRATTHQLVRHRRDVAYSQESQRYVNYDKKGLKFIDLTMEPAKFLDWCEKNNLHIDNFFLDYDRGVVSCTSIGMFYRNQWVAGIEHAAKAYHDLMRDIVLDNEAKTKLPIMPQEVARGLLPNDTATKIGVTWFMPNGFTNLLHLRLDAHAQYAIRSTVARIFLKAVLEEHPFINLINPDLVITWLGWIKDQRIFRDNTELDKAIDIQKKFLDEINAYMQEQMKQQAEAIKKQQEAAKDAPPPKVIKIGGDNQPAPTPAEPVTERAPTVTFEKPKEAEETPAEPAK